MQTHKNTALRKTSQVNSSAKPYSAPKPKSVVKTEVVKDPVFELDGKKWMVRYFSDLFFDKLLIRSSTKEETRACKSMET